MKWLVILALQTAWGTGGVAVGNGEMAYLAPGDRFQVAYPKALSLEQKDSDHYEISNGKLTAPNEPVSKVTFVVTRDQVPNADELKAYAQRNFSARNFQALELPGAKGLASEIRTTDHLDGIYLLLTENLDFIEVKVDAYAAAQGLNLLAPIIHSFTYDRTPPHVDQIRFPNSVWPAGSVQTVWVHATDDNSGLNLAWALVHFDELNKHGNEGPGYFASGSTLKPQGNNWYSYTIHLGRYIKPGTYVMDMLDISDNAENMTRLYADVSDRVFKLIEFYRFNLARDLGPTAFQVPQVQVINPGIVDFTPPVLHEIRIDHGPWQTDRPRRIFLRITDDQTGVAVKSLFCRNLSSGKEAVFEQRSNCDHPRHEGGDWYSLLLQPNPYLPDGEYGIQRIEISDKAGNNASYLDPKYLDKSANNGHYFRHVVNVEDVATNISIFKLKLHNTGTADITPPELFDLQIVDPIWTAGERKSLRFRARDLQSGIAGVSLTLSTSSGDRKIPAVIIPMDKIVSEGNDWFRWDFTIDPYAAAGKYFVSRFYTADHADNSTDWVCNLEAPGITCNNSNGPAMPPIEIQIVR